MKIKVSPGIAGWGDWGLKAVGGGREVGVMAGTRQTRHARWISIKPNNSKVIARALSR